MFLFLLFCVYPGMFPWCGLFIFMIMIFLLGLMLLGIEVDDIFCLSVLNCQLNSIVIASKNG